MSETLLRAGVAVALLGLGMLVNYLRASPSRGDGLRIVESVWLHRRADLLVQVALILVGALGVRALLPGEDEEEAPDGSVD